MVIVYSATKGLAAMTLALAHSRGWLDYEERVAAYWPEFAQQGKERITVRQLLAHQAGLYVLDEPLDRSLVADLDRLAVVLARQKPASGAGDAPGLSRHHPRVLRERTAASDRSWPSQPGTVLPGRDRIPPRAGRLHPAARGHPQRAAGDDGAALVGRPPARLPAAPGARRDESTVEDLAGAEGVRVASRPRAHLRAQSRGALRRCRGHGAGDRACVQRLRHGRPGARAASGDDRVAGGPGSAPDPGVLRRVHEGRRRPVLARVHEAESRAAVRRAAVVRLAGRRRSARLCRSRGRHRLRLRDQQDGHAVVGRPEGRGAARRAVRRLHVRSTRT